MFMLDENKRFEGRLQGKYYAGGKWFECSKVSLSDAEIIAQFPHAKFKEVNDVKEEVPEVVEVPKQVKKK